MNNTIGFICFLLFAFGVQLLAEGECNSGRNSESNLASDFVMIPSSSLNSILKNINESTDIRTSMALYMNGYYDVVLNRLVEQEITYEKKISNGIWYNLGMQDAINFLETYDTKEDRNNFFARLGFHKQKITGVIVNSHKLYIPNPERQLVRLFANKNIAHALNSTESDQKNVRFMTIEGWVGPKLNYIYPPIVGDTFSYVMIVTEISEADPKVRPPGS
jgi:hypothetical protein